MILNVLITGLASALDIGHVKDTDAIEVIYRIMYCCIVETFQSHFHLIIRYILILISGQWERNIVERCWLMVAVNIPLIWLKVTRISMLSFYFTA